MKNIVLLFVVAFAFCTTAIASDIAFYIGQWNTDSWYGPEQFDHVETIIAETGHLFRDIQHFDDTQFDEFGAWVDENTDDGEMDIIWLNGCMPSVLYPNPNRQPDGSRAEEWLDGGNMIINVGDLFAAVTFEGGTRGVDNGPVGAANILDLSSGIFRIGPRIQMTVTRIGKEYLPSLNDPAATRRPVVLGAVQDPWEVAAIFASGGGTDDAAIETHADPVVIHNTKTGGYLAIINQAAGGGPPGWIDDRGLTCAEFIGNWVNDVIGLGRGNPLARRPDPKDGALYEDTWVTLGWRAGALAVSHDVYFGENFDDVNDGVESTFQSNQTSTSFVVGFPGFPYPDGLVPGTTYYWRIDEVNDLDSNSPWTGDVWSFSVPPKTAYYPIPADGAEFIDPDVELSWTGGFGAKLHTIYFGDNFDEVSNATGGPPQGATTYTPGTLELEKVYYWRVDEFDAVETYKGGVWGFTTPGAVGSLNPSNGTVDVKQIQTLSWLPGDHAASHELYLGTDKEAVRNADTSSPEYKGTMNLGSESYEPGNFLWDTTYYWRIDEVNNANPDSPWVGLVWSFTTANFLVVDDFESYNDIDPPDPESNRIFEAWSDGYEIPTNGALVGNELPPYAEQSIVHSGIQSMPYFYDNSVGYSEATLTLTYPRDWTENGVNTLTIWFRGNSDNAAETLHVALNGSAVVNHDNPEATQIGRWTEWNIDLQAFCRPGG